MKAKKIIPKDRRFCNFLGRLGLILLLGLWLLFNIVASQIVPPLYFRLVNDDHLAAITYLKQIRLFPQFLAELEKYRQIYGVGIENFVFAGERERELVVQKYELALQKNPQAVTALYNLSLLYEEGDNQQKADEYLKLAKELDPIIK